MKKIIAGIAALLLISTLAVSYAFFSASVTKKNETQTSLKSNVLGLIYTGVTEINIKDIVPGDYMKKTFTVENITSHAVDFNIYMENITNEFNADLIYVLEDEDGVVVEQSALPETKSGKSYLKTSIPIEKDEIKSYTLTIKLLYISDENQNALQGKIFKGTVGIDTEDVDGRYSISGIVKKIESDNTTSLVISGNLVFFSEHQDVPIQSNGTFDATNLEMGNHEVYYMGDLDASSMTKEQVKANAICEATLSTKQYIEVILTCKGNAQISLDDIEVKKEIPKKDKKIILTNDVSGDKVVDVGDEISVESESFYVISNQDGKVSALAKYNLNVGYYTVDGTYGIQNPLATYKWDAEPGEYAGYGSVMLADNLWFPTASIADMRSYSGEVYDALYGNETFEGYEKYLQKIDNSISVRLVTYDELYELGCNMNSCLDAPAWTYSTAYWTSQSLGSGSRCVTVQSRNAIVTTTSTGNTGVFGVRPVIEVNLEDIKVD